MLDTNISRHSVMVMTAVNFGELKVSQNPAETLVAFSIGSGIAVSVYESVIKAGGLLNFILPDSSAMSAQKVESRPFLFADTGLAALLDALHDRGAQAENLKIVIAGGAQILDQTAAFNISHQNNEAVTAFFSCRNLDIAYADIGGVLKRSLRLDIGSGENVVQRADQGDVKI